MADGGDGGSGIVVLRWDTTTGYDIVVSGGSVTEYLNLGLSGNEKAIALTDTTDYTFTVTGGGPSSPYDAWASSFDWSGYTSPDRTATGNPDGDAWTNLQEFAFGFNPAVSDGGSALAISGGSITQNGPPQIHVDPVTGQFFLRYTRRADYVAAGLGYTAHSRPTRWVPVPLKA